MVKDQDFNSIKELSPKAIKLGFDSSVTILEKNNENTIGIITMIEQLHIIWLNEV